MFLRNNLTFTTKNLRIFAGGEQVKESVSSLDSKQCFYLKLIFIFQNSYMSKLLSKIMIL